MHVYLSWSGEAGGFAAKALHEWLPGVVSGLEIIRFAEDTMTGSGVPLFKLIMDGLSRADACIVCAAPEGFASPWVNFEVGFLACRGDKVPLYPLVLTSDTAPVIKGPLQMYPSILPKQDQIWHMVLAIGSRANSRVNPSFLESVFSQHWPLLKRKLDEAMKKSGESTPIAANESTVAGEELALSNNAKFLLTHAMLDPTGRILSSATLSGRFIQTAGRQFTEVGNPRSEAQWLSALRELAREGLIEASDAKESVFAVTARGYQVADRLQRV
jgi:hypothetical protein